MRRAPRPPPQTHRGTPERRRPAIAPSLLSGRPGRGRQTRSSNVSLGRARRHLPRQLIDEALTDEPRGHRHTVSDRFRRRATVSDDAEAVQAEEWRAAVLGRIDTPAKP